jgi:RND family efflux transporter MFP subunit
VPRPRPLLLGFAAILSGVSGCAPRNQYAPPPPPAVTVAHPVQRPVTEFVELTGTTQSFARVELRARVNGYLESLHFEDGATVKKNDLLFAIDPKPFQATLAAARAKLDEAEANLKAARESKRIQVAEAAVLISRAQLLVAQLAEARGRRLLETGAQPREVYDQQAAGLKTAQADLESKQADLQQATVNYESGIALGEAAVNSAKADLTNAELQLAFTEVRAPIGGRIGRHLVDVGNLVQAEMTLLATIEAYDPINVYFTISESQALYFIRLRQQGKLPPLGSVPIALHMSLGNEEGFPHEGRFNFAEVGIDPETGSTLRRGVFPNADGTIVPGLFARVRGAVGEPSPGLLVPERALGVDQQGRYLLVVNGQNVVEHRSVSMGRIKEGGLRVIEQGLKGDEWVVIDGLLRARPGAKVDPKPGDALAFVGPPGTEPKPVAAKAGPTSPPDPRQPAPGAPTTTTDGQQAAPEAPPAPAASGSPPNPAPDPGEGAGAAEAPAPTPDQGNAADRTDAPPRED